MLFTFEKNPVTTDTISNLDGRLVEYLTFYADTLSSVDNTYAFPPVPGLRLDPAVAEYALYSFLRKGGHAL